MILFYQVADITQRLKSAARTGVGLTPHDDQGIEWRLARFLEQLKPIHPPATLPLLIAFDAGPRRKEDCLSCSELRKDGDGFLCARCVTAKRLALDIWFARLVKIENVS